MKNVIIWNIPLVFLFKCIFKSLSTRYRELLAINSNNEHLREPQNDYITNQSIRFGIPIEYLEGDAQIITSERSERSSY